MWIFSVSIPRSSRRNLTRFFARSKPLFWRSGVFLPLTMSSSVRKLERRTEYHEYTIGDSMCRSVVIVLAAHRVTYNFVCRRGTLPLMDHPRSVSTSQSENLHITQP